jgi:hypothetical protein
MATEFTRINVICAIGVFGTAMFCSACGRNSKPDSSSGSANNAARESTRVERDGNRLVLKHKELFVAAGFPSYGKVEQVEPVASYALLKRFPFLRIRPEQTILKGTLKVSGKGEESTFENYLLKTDRGTFQLDLHGDVEFVHFDWEVTTENAEMLFRRMVHREGVGEYIVPTQRYDRIKERIEAKYPGSIVNGRPITIAPPRLVTQSGRVYVHCEAIVYIRDGIYYDEGSIENSFVKYAVDLGNGFVESDIEVLIRGPYRTDPAYWGDTVTPPSDEKERNAIVEEFERMKGFQKFAQGLLGRIEEADTK